MIFRTLADALTALKTKQSFQTLSLEDNNIGDAGAKKILAALSKNTALIKIEFSDKTISVKVLDQINAIIQRNIERTYQDARNMHELRKTDNASMRSAYDALTAALNAAKQNNDTKHIDEFKPYFVEYTQWRIEQWALLLQASASTHELHFRKISDDDAVAISEALKAKSTIKDLSLLGNNLSVFGVYVIAESLETNQSLETFFLASTNVDDQGASAIAEMLIRNTTLRTLSLLFNKIGAKGADDIANMLTINKTLVTLHLQSNNIGEKGATAIAEMLKTNKTLEELVLHRNNIGDKGAIAISDALVENTTLKTLYLYDNNIGTSGALAMARMLRNNKTLTTLNLGGNPIDDAAAKVILEALKENTTLTELGIDCGMIISKETMDSIKSIIQRNIDSAKSKATVEDAKAPSTHLDKSAAPASMVLMSDASNVLKQKAVAEKKDASILAVPTEKISANQKRL